MAHTQDILGQLPLLQSYTHAILCFQLASHASPPMDLEPAVQRLLTLFPILAGQVIKTGASPTSSGAYQVVPYPVRPSPLIRYVDHTSDPQVPSYNSLRTAHFPFHQMPSSLFSPPHPVFPIPYPDTAPAPVLALQANILNGGFLLTLAAQHNIIDASGIFQIASLLARLTRGELIPQAEITEGNLDRRNLIPLLEDHQPLRHDYREYLPSCMPTKIPPNLTALFPTFQWAYFHLARRAVEAIYAETTTTTVAPLPSSSSSSQHTPVKITPNDALTAFIWQRLTLTRLHHSPSPLSATSSVSKISRAMDLRRTLHLTPAYLGHMIRTVTLRLPLGEITSLPLATLAARLREQVDELRTMEAVRDYATFLAREPDKSKIAYSGGEFHPATDFSCSSIAHVDFGRLRLGDGARCEGGRRPEGGVLPGVCYIGPAGDWYDSGGAEGSQQKGIEVLMCLDGWEMEGLREDERWREWVEYIG
ncbi:hypothetical protein AbraIFM66950_005611 [Aspergillus brasiliensis]|nr:hypothetical protein AbraIFM66950_005611 [Aspergillus brasiliensis]